MLKVLKIMSMLGFIKEANLNELNAGFKIFTNLEHLSHCLFFNIKQYVYFFKGFRILDLKKL